MTRHSFAAALLCSGTLILGGCSKSDQGFVQKGSVSFQGAPVTSGVVRFHMANNRLANAIIQPDGTFEATEVIPGEAKVTVEDDPGKLNQKIPIPRTGAAPPAAKQPAPQVPGVPEPTAKAVPIPAKYKDPEKSGLVFTLSPNVPIEIQLSK